MICDVGLLPPILVKNHVGAVRDPNFQCDPAPVLVVYVALSSSNYPCKQKNEPRNKIETRVSMHNNSLLHMEVGIPSTFPGAKTDFLEDSKGMQTSQVQCPTCRLRSLYPVLQAIMEKNLQ